MSDLYTELNDQSNLISKGHQGRACVVCLYPVVDENATSINAGDGLELLVHKGCLHAVTEALAPKAETIPVTKSVTRKGTVMGSPIDEKRLASDIKEEMYKLLLAEGLRQAQH